MGGVLAYAAKKAADRDNQLGQSRHLAASAEAALSQDPELATLLSLEALKVRDIPAAETALRASLPQIQVTATLAPPPPARSAMFSSDGSRIVTASGDGTIRIYDAHSYQQIVSLGGFGPLNGAALNPAGTEIVTADEDGTARVIDARNGNLLGLLAPRVGGRRRSRVPRSAQRKADRDDRRRRRTYTRIWDARTDPQSGRSPTSASS